jgi:GT2 family glycosyltransferase
MMKHVVTISTTSSLKSAPSGPPGKPDIGAVVTNYNGGAGVIRCIESLLDSDVPVREIIVVDGASTDGSAESVEKKFPQTKIIQLGKNLGPCVARNAGMRKLSTDLALLIDDDIHLAPSALKQMAEAIDDSVMTLVCPRILLYPETQIIHTDGVTPHFLGTMSLRHGFDDVVSHGTTSVEVGGCISACILAERSVMLQAGGFEEAYFFYFEDLEFSIRLRSRGYAFVCVQHAIAYHDRGTGTEGLSFRGPEEYPERRFYLTSRNRLMTILIHYQLSTIIVLAPVLILYELVTLIFALSRGFNSAYVRSIYWQAQNRRMICRLRAAAKQSRTVANSKILDGGTIPLAPGVVRSALLRCVVVMLSACFNVYWRVARLIIR